MNGAHHDGEDVEADGAHWSPCHLWSQWRNRLLSQSMQEHAMSNSKNTVNGASWMRRGLVAIAGAAMAFTALSAAPSQDAPVDDEVAVRVSSKKAPRLDDSIDFGGGGTTSAMRGGSWG